MMMIMKMRAECMLVMPQLGWIRSDKLGPPAYKHNHTREDDNDDVNNDDDDDHDDHDDNDEHDEHDELDELDDDGDESE